MSVTMREHAIAAARQGFRVFPLAPMAKVPPAGVSPPEVATCDLASVFELWTDPATGASTYCNIGILMGPGLVALDVDVAGAHKEDGRAAADAMDLPRTRAHRTPTGGTHVIYAVAPGAELVGRDLAPGVNVKTKNGYIVGPGSRVAAGVYTVIDLAPIAPVPAHVAEKLAKGRPGPPASITAADPSTWDSPAAVQAASRYLAEFAPVAIEGLGGDGETFRVACRVLDFGVSPETALALMSGDWNERCQPPWEYDDLAQKVDNARAYKQDPIGRDDPARALDAFAPIPDAPGRLNALIEFPEDIERETLLTRRVDALAKGLIGRTDQGMIYGASTAGKSFAALDLAMCLANGKPWAGLKVKKSAVLYVALEGVDGFQARIYAATKHHGNPGDAFGRLKVPVTLSRVDAAGGETGTRLVIEAATLLKRKCALDRGVIFIDTLARAIAGDEENSAQDMMHFYEKRAKVISEATKMAVILVHHTNAAGTVRGSSSNVPSLDFVIRADHDKETGERTLTVEKNKDGAQGPLLAYRLKPFEIGVDAEGDALETCIVEPVEDAPGARRHEREQWVLAKATALIGQGETLSPQAHSRKCYAGRVLFREARGKYTISQIAEALATLEALGALTVEEYAVKGNVSLRYNIARAH